MDFDDFDLDWVTETVRSHREAAEQLQALPPDARDGMMLKLARRSLVLGSKAFVEFVETVSAQGKDMARYRDQKDAMSPEALSALEATMTARVVVLRIKIAAFKLLLEGT